MATQDKCCSIEPCFKVKPGQMVAFKKLCEQFIEKTKTEQGCLYYGFAFDGDMAVCREGYVDGDAALTHLKNVGPLIQESLIISELVRLEITGPEMELAKLRGPTAPFKPKFFVLECGIRK